MHSGQLIANRYRLVELIGSGGAGLVWLADDEVEHRRVALKRPHSAEGPAARTELEREARVAARVDHPNAIRVHEVVGDGPDSWLVMEYFPARDLGAVLRERGPLDPAEVARIGAQVAAALAAIHEADVVHRDVTPNNILVADGGEFSGVAKVTDYGISAHRAQTVTSSGKISGTAVYVSPEVADGSGAKAPSDVFSLGASLFAAVEGEPPFGFGDPDLILARIRAGRREPARRAGPLAPVLEALLHGDRDARPTAARARDMLAQVVDGQPVEAWQPPVPRRRRRDRRVLAAGVVAVLLAGGVVVWSPWQTSAGDPAEPTGPKRTVIGDPRTADPCALVEPETFERYGTAVEDPAYGNFNRCDVLIELGEDTEVDVDLELLAPTDPSVEPKPDATIEVEAAEPDDEGGCDVSITLADLYRIDVNARPHGDVTLDLCEVAQVAGDRAVDLLPPRGELARRPEPFDPDSLARVDACKLLDRAALRAIPGLDPEPSVAYGRWVCEWSGRAATMGAELFFNQNTTLTAEDGELVRLAGHDVFLEPDEDGEQECRAHVVHRPVHLDNGEDIDEIASLSITGDAPVSRLCTVGRTMARSVAANLPPVS
ncbi:MAG: serine/threonine-protein kinase [Actinophytocola sp.]|uniref:serine/threonine-protein kinase n=1 Tax=Actinophytocola sp. TaxID=1872138 RepID=UPI003D6A201B